MNRQQAKAILLLYRPESADANDPEFAEALALAREDAALGRWFEEHCSVQRTIRKRFRQIEVPRGLKEQILSEHKARSVVLWWREPVVLAAAAVVVVLLGIAALWLRSGPHQEEAETFATYRSRMASAVLRNYAMSLETNSVAEIRAHLAQNQAPSEYVLPKKLEETPLAGCGVLSWQATRVSMLCFLTGKPLEPGQKSDLYLFVVDRAALPDAPAAAEPQFARVNKLLTASWSVGDTTYILAGEGDEEFLRQYL